MENEKEAPFLGALLDERSEEEKQKDYQFEEIVSAAAPVNWAVNENTRRFPIFDQDGSGSCVAQTIAKLAGVMYAEANDGEYVHFSASDIYQRRNNKPSAGMNGVDAFDIARKSITLEALAPSQNMNDAQMDGLQIAEYKHRVGEIFRFGNYVKVPVRDIDTIASIIMRTNKAVMVWFYFKRDEWKKNIPEVKYKDLVLGANTTARHSVSAVDYTLLPDGRKALIIEDSWGNDTGIEGQRIITEDFFRERNWFAAYPINFKFMEMEDEPIPAVNFTRTLEWSMDTSRKDDDVAKLQTILKIEGMFPKNVQSTGYYGSITAKAVLAWQLKFMPEYGEDKLRELEGKIVGPATREALNKKYTN